MVATSLATPPPTRSSTTVAHDHNAKSSSRPVPSHASNSKVQATLPSRRLSLPDMRELRSEWARREALQINALPPGKLQVRVNAIDTSHFSNIYHSRLICSMFDLMSK